MPKAKTRGNPQVTRRARNARRQADTWIRNFTNAAQDTSLTKNQREIFQRRATQLQELKEQTYFKTNSQKEIRQATARIRDIAGGARISKGKNGLSNYFMQEQINQATKKVVNNAGEAVYAGTSIFTPEQVHVFYAATQDLWQGKTRGGYDSGITDTSSINKNIMRGLGTKTLQEAWDIVFSYEENRKAARMEELANKRKEEQLTEEELALLNALLDDAAYEGKYSDSTLYSFTNTTDTIKL